LREKQFTFSLFPAFLLAGGSAAKECQQGYGHDSENEE
jgi:hypothetical protein